MQTGIDRTRVRPRTRRKTDLHPNTAEFIRHTKWLSWPFLFWRGYSTADVAAEDAFAPSLSEVIVRRLRRSSPGLYALQPGDVSNDCVRLVAITRQKLASASHALALVERKEGCDHDFESMGDESRILLRARLAALSRCWKEVCGAVAVGGARAGIGQVAWILDGVEVLPPAKIYHLLRKYSGLGLPEVGPAMMEFMLRAESSDLRVFLTALEELVKECDHALDEPIRRQGMLRCLLKETDAVQPAYYQRVFEAHRGRIIKWQPNPEFAAEAPRIFLRHYLPPIAARAIIARTPKGLSFEKMCGWMVGAEMPSFTKGPLVDSPNPPDVAARLITESTSAEVPTFAKRRSRILKIAACYATIAGDPAAPRKLAAWLRAGRQLSRGGHCEGALPALEQWLEDSMRDRENLQQLLTLLEARSVELFSQGWIRTVSPPPTFAVLARLGGLRAEDALAVVDLGLIHLAHHHFGEDPGHLAAFLAWVKPRRQAWESIDHARQSMWLALFSEPRDPRLLPRLVSWAEHLIRVKGYTLLDVTAFAEGVHKFLMNDEDGERRQRESFLAGNFWLLARLLDDVETTLRLLPPEKFDRWRSHERLWNRRLGILDLALQWQASGFPELEGMVEDVLMGCRREDAIALAREDTNPPGHFASVSWNEQVVVRLSGGSSRHLLALLEYYVEHWNFPDHPFAGWRFLDRYPAIQETIRQFCQRPARLRATVNLLRRFAMGVRLQSRAFFHAQLCQWMDALAQEDPLESLRAFGQLAGYVPEMQVAVERIVYREETLRREWKTLRKLHSEDRLPASAAKRLIKLDRLLSDPAIIAAWIENDLHKLLEKTLPIAKMDALSRISREAVRDHWKRAIDRHSSPVGRDWDNALLFYHSASQNKVVLRKLLQHFQEPEGQWRLRHPPNARFLAELRGNGFDADGWLLPYQVTREVRGDTWSIYVEQDPLRVLQMGNLFGTCLSANDFNAFSAIANAVEINKKVIYLRDGFGNVVGRKLIGLTAQGALFGFRSYGAACVDDLHGAEQPHVWIKILFDLACLEIARRAKATFDRSEDLTQSADQLRLSADWYNDGPEVFDWWIASPELQEPITNGDKAPVTAAVLVHLRKRGFKDCDRQCPPVETLRAMLWLGDDAAKIVEDCRPMFVGTKFGRFLLHQSPSAAVRALVQTTVG